jgi:hypothetical protein
MCTPAAATIAGRRLVLTLRFVISLTIPTMGSNWGFACDFDMCPENAEQSVEVRAASQGR